MIPKAREAILANGKADLIALGRGLIADPDWADKARAGRPETIRKCIGCLQGCIGTQMTAGFANCMPNPEMGREKNMDLIPAETPKKVSHHRWWPLPDWKPPWSPACADTTSSYAKKESRLGGQWNLAYVPPGKEDFRWVVDWRVDRINDLANSDRTDRMRG